jgi:NAD(P)-dependent dehydrogenase (short-subunit alcohol dehydrogenase family)
MTTPTPAASRGIGRLLCRARSQRTGTRVCVLRGGAGPAIRSQAAKQGRARQIAANIAKVPELLRKA